ncbi:ImmA/IrrE family metallo-endopeptidase [Dehalobacter sp.]|uniref:ImmA/IrrE family metallo-endopeptidase n=1 Tax=Dehalobacter sp. TaxID=1962289 RepID=UPI00258BEBF6|nr:ImmA/IrrE family metallo-endopeptidase [Dehalobacter sp.]MDJ0305359.1 ImmA/IrrE family metallo-endopeptidase [Dehalobacter sp.]
MTRYEALCQEICKQGIKIYEVPMNPRNKGLYSDNIICINQRMDKREKICTIAEEHAHYLTTSGNILDLTDVRNRKQEKRARNWAYEKLIPLQSFVKAYKEGIRNRYELAEFLEVTEEFLDAAISRYKEKYGLYVEWTSYLIYFDPLGVFESFEGK